MGSAETLQLPDESADIVLSSVSFHHWADPEPKTVFYDWLYCSFLADYRDWAEKLYGYAGFTDIEFNPSRSINCQARSAALFLSLLKRGKLDAVLDSPSRFIQALSDSQYRPELRRGHLRLVGD